MVMTRTPLSVKLLRITHTMDKRRLNQHMWPRSWPGKRPDQAKSRLIECIRDCINGLYKTMQFRLFWSLWILHNIRKPFLTSTLLSMRERMLLRIDTGFWITKAEKTGKKRNFCYVYRYTTQLQPGCDM